MSEELIYPFTRTQIPHILFVLFSRSYLTWLLLFMAFDFDFVLLFHSLNSLHFFCCFFFLIRLKIQDYYLFLLLLLLLLVHIERLLFSFSKMMYECNMNVVPQSFLSFRLLLVVQWFNVSLSTFFALHYCKLWMDRCFMTQ